MKKTLLILATAITVCACEKESKVNDSCRIPPFHVLTLVSPTNGETMPPSGSSVRLHASKASFAQVAWHVYPDDGKLSLTEVLGDTASNLFAVTTSALTVGASYTFTATADVGGRYCPTVDSVTLTVADGYTSSDCGDGLGMKIGSTCWANSNVDDYKTFALRPDMYTKFYQWDKERAWNATEEEFGDGSFTMPSHDWTINPCPEGWRMPKWAELESMYRTGSTWRNDSERGNSVAGRFYGVNHATCSLPDNMVGCVFLPASGRRVGSSSAGRIGEEAGYWSGTYQLIEGGGHLNNSLTFVSSTDRFSMGNDIMGYSIRCVRQ